MTPNRAPISNELAIQTVYKMVTKEMRQTLYKMEGSKEREAKTDDTNNEEKYKPVIVWQNVFKFAVLHLLGLNGLLLFQTVTLKTVIFSTILWLVACVVSGK